MTTEQWDRAGYALLGLFFIWCCTADPEFFPMFTVIGWFPAMVYLALHLNKQG